jgi:hypothetical protein
VRAVDRDSLTVSAAIAYKTDTLDAHRPGDCRRPKGLRDAKHGNDQRDRRESVNRFNDQHGDIRFGQGLESVILPKQKQSQEIR